MTKILNAESRVSKKARSVVESVIEIHEKYKSSYFWSSGANASNRRSNEKRFENLLPSVDGIKTKKGLVTWDLSYRESCSYCYYSAAFYLDGEKKNITLLKNIIK